MSLLGSLRGLYIRPYQQIQAVEARGRLDGGVILLDVRESNEWEAGHVQGARHLSLGQLGQRQRSSPSVGGSSRVPLRLGMHAWVASGCRLSPRAVAVRVGAFWAYMTSIWSS